MSCDRSVDGAARGLTLLLAALALGTGSCQGDEALYGIDIIGPKEAFVGATSVSLLLNDKVVATSAVSGEGAFSLEATGIDPVNDPSAIFVVKAVDAQNRTVALGQTPNVEILPTPNPLRVFVQKPGTLARSSDLGVQLTSMSSWKAETQPMGTLVLAMTAPVFGLGLNAAGALTSEIYIYNPVVHRTQQLANIGLARAHSAATARSDDGELFVFGGLAADDMNVISPSKHLDLMTVGRQTFATFLLPDLRPLSPDKAAPADPELARAGSVFAAAGPRHIAFGGLDQARQPLASVVVVEESAIGVSVTSAHPPMAAARVGHTATTDLTTVSSASLTEVWGRILIYGGAAPGAPVAELLNPKAQMWLPAIDFKAAGPAGTGRRDHQALTLPTKTDKDAAQILILGGRDDANHVRGDSVICVPAEARCGPSPLVLQIPRSSFGAFLLKDDLVVIGGIGADEMPVGTAEIYNANTLAFVKTLPAVARAVPAITTLPSLAAVILGGEAAGLGVTAVEIYQPTLPDQAP